MKIERIANSDITLAVIVRSEDWEEGVNFISSELDFQQVNFWRYNKEQKLYPHMHLEAPRQVLKTQEVIFVKQGRLRANIFGTDKKLFKSIELETGDTAVFLNGGHGYEILEDDTRVLEIKNGPYIGREKDRERI